MLIFSCEESSEFIPNSEQTTGILKTVEYGSLSAEIPSDFPDNVGSLNYYDLKLIGENLDKKSRQAGEMKSFWDVFETVKKRYPDLTNFEPNEYQKFFPRMNVDEIIKNQEEVLSFIESLIGYETAVEFSKNESNNYGNRNGKLNYGGYDPNPCEIWYFAGHARLDLSGIGDAMNLAFQYGGYGNNDDSDARRHGILSVLVGKYGAHRYATVSKAREVTEGFLEAHECEDYGMSKVMDLHNNKVGLNYFEIIAERYKEGLFNYSVRVNTSDSEISNYVHNMSIVFKSTEAEINAVNGSTLVRIQ